MGRKIGDNQLPEGRLVPAYPEVDRDARHALFMVHGSQRKGATGELLLCQSQRLAENGVIILATEGTAKYLEEAGIPARNVKVLHGLNPENNHLTASLSFETFIGILSEPDTPEHMQRLEELGLPKISFTFITFYPDPSDTTNVRDMIDVGGPSHAHAAAKNATETYTSSIVVTRFENLNEAVDWYLALPEPGCRESFFPTRMASIAHFDVAMHIGSAAEARSKGRLRVIGLEVEKNLRYGENPHQQASLYRPATGRNPRNPFAWENFTALGDTNLGYCNFTDVEALCRYPYEMQMSLIRNNGQFPMPARSMAFAVKHGNACGAAIGGTNYIDGRNRPYEDVITDMIEGDEQAVFGSFVLLTETLTAERAHLLRFHHWEGGKHGRPIDGVIAPAIEEEALPILKRIKGQCQLLVNPKLQTDTLRAAIDSLGTHSLPAPRRELPLLERFLIQSPYNFAFYTNNVRWAATTPHFKNPSWLHVAIAFLRPLAGATRSNCVAVGEPLKLRGNGGGAKDRYSACMAAIEHLPEVKAGEPGQLVMVSDSFLIDPNIVVEAYRHGVGTIVAPDGSASDDKIIEACQKVGMNLGFTPLKESREFFGHG